MFVFYTLFICHRSLYRCDVIFYSHSYNFFHLNDLNTLVDPDHLGAMIYRIDDNYLAEDQSNTKGLFLSFCTYLLFTGERLHCLIQNIRF